MDINIYSIVMMVITSMEMDALVIVKFKMDTLVEEAHQILKIPVLFISHQQ